MKKLFAMLVAAVCAMSAMATEYNGKIAVSINGEGGSQPANVTLNQEENGSYSLLIKNFCLVDGETKMGIGNITVDSLNAITDFEELGYVITKAEARNIVITEGDDESVTTWLGPMLGEVPITMTATFNEQALVVNIDIFFAPLNQNIKVDFIGKNPDATPGPQGKKGDVNGDGDVDVADVNAVINIMLDKEE